MMNIIVAAAEDGAIGRSGDLVFHVRGDMRHFKELTMGHTVVMGRKTFESLPKGALPGRRNIVISRNSGFVADGAEVVTSLEAAFEAAAGTPEREVFIIGGGSIYAAAMPLADRLYITEFKATAPDADTFFPEINAQEWRQEERSEIFTDENSGMNYVFVTYCRRRGEKYISEP